MDRRRLDLQEDVAGLPIARVSPDLRPRAT
jgi:hypothetical protein